MAKVILFIGFILSLFGLLLTGLGVLDQSLTPTGSLIVGFAFTLMGFLFMFELSERE